MSKFSSFLILFSLTSAYLRQVQPRAVSKEVQVVDLRDREALQVENFQFKSFFAPRSFEATFLRRSAADTADHRDSI